MTTTLLTLAIIALVIWIVLAIMRVAASWGVLGIAIVLFILWLVFR